MFFSGVGRGVSKRSEYIEGKKILTEIDSLENEQ